MIPVVTPLLAVPYVGFCLHFLVAKPRSKLDMGKLGSDSEPLNHPEMEANLEVGWAEAETETWSETTMEA